MKPHSERRHGGEIPEINLKTGMPPVRDAMAIMERALARARAEGEMVVKFIHGYGSSGAGGEIRIAVQRRLREMENTGTIRACIFGEDWGKSDARAWELLKAQPRLKQDHDLGRKNQGITVVVL
jgi:hypothetical protein